MYFGVVYILNQCLGLITPPVGAVLNVISTIGKMPMNKVGRAYGRSCLRNPS